MALAAPRAHNRLMIRERWLFGRSSRTFTLQWHLTNACGFHCAHCYDRSDRSAPSWETAQKVLADLQAFCAHQRVAPHVCLSGGDPLAYPHFWDLCALLARQKIAVSILGNPLPSHQISRLLQTLPPRSYQVSLEGLEAVNDRIRGPGHYRQCMQFLRDSRRLGLRTHVMLTLGKGNLDQVLPLADELRGLTQRFTFNRLCQVGGGASLEVPTPAQYEAFLKAYLAHGHLNPLLGFKDNLFNILRDRSGNPLFGGCTGHGCGAAFNFVALLPDGEVHACRKFPSPLGHLPSASLLSLYNSPAAKAYRDGPAACSTCHLKTNCRGCMAVSFGQGLDPLHARDPHCFLPTAHSSHRHPAAPQECPRSLHNTHF